MQENKSRLNKKYRLALIILLLVFFFAVSIFVFYYYYSQAGIQQPVPFSHIVHVSENKINCIKCHEGTLDDNKPVIPTLQTCMSCHDKVNINDSSIRYLREHYSAGKPIEWKKVTNFDTFVNFNHSVHTKRGIDCSKCHGNIAEMKRVKEEVTMDMKFCTGCHSAENVKADCNSCHN
jgi:hypothetical protein